MLPFPLILGGIEIYKSEDLLYVVVDKGQYAVINHGKGKHQIKLTADEANFLVHSGGLIGLESYSVPTHCYWVNPHAVRLTQLISTGSFFTAVLTELHFGSTKIYVRESIGDIRTKLRQWSAKGGS